LANLAEVSIPQNTLPSKQKEPVLKEALDWLRNNNPNAANVSDPTLRQVADLAGISMPKKSPSPPQKQKV
jgi:hypothetical protein